MVTRGIRCAPVLAWALLLGLGSAGMAQDLTYADPIQQKVLAQQQQNINAQNAAVQLEASLVTAGNQAFSAKDFPRAADCFRRALSVTYNVWQFRTGTVGSIQIILPTDQPAVMRLSTQNTKTALDRLNAIPAAAQAEDQATAQKKMQDLFTKAEAAAPPMNFAKADKPDAATTTKNAANAAKAYRAYEDIIAIATAQGEKKMFTDGANKARDAEKKILAEAGKPLDEVQKAITAGNAEDATAKLASFNKDYGGLLAVAADLKKRFDQLQASPDIKKQLQEQDTQKLIQVGDLALLREDYVIAARYYRKAAMLYPDSAASVAATEKLTQLQANPKAADVLKPEGAAAK